MRPSQHNITYETQTRLACDVSRVRHVSDTDTRKSVSDTPNEVSNFLIFFRTRGHGKDTRRTRLETRQGTRVVFKKKKLKKLKK